MHRHELTQAEWDRIRPLIPSRTGPRAKRGDRDFINAVIWRVRTGVQWRDLPERFGSWKTVYNRFHRWAKTGRWKAIFEELRLEADEDELGSLVDASVVRAHQDAAGGKGGSDEMLWGVLEEVFQRRFTPSQRRAVSQSTWSSPRSRTTGGQASSGRAGPRGRGGGTHWAHPHQRVGSTSRGQRGNAHFPAATGLAAGAARRGWRSAVTDHRPANARRYFSCW